ncbi:MAG: hypothetical protein VXZ82_07405 [Planctomycetota bacterium]|nr:hypothetical protein [Planctomycetota bacterium]
MSRISLSFLTCALLGCGLTGCSLTPKNDCNVVCEDREMAQDFWTSYYRNHHWPAPFRAMDTSSILAHFETQRNNGWKLYNTLGTAMFDHDTGDLNSSGLAHVEWITTQAPADRRVVFVMKGEDAEDTANRIEATQVAISRLIPTGDLPPIYLTDREAHGSSGAYQTAISRAILTSTPSPRLPTDPTGGGSSSASP